MKTPEKPEFVRDFSEPSPPENWDFFTQLAKFYETQPEIESEFDFIGGYENTSVIVTKNSGSEIPQVKYFDFKNQFF